METPFEMVQKKILDWEQVVNDGFGDRHNVCAWSMVQYKNYLYVGTLNFTSGCKIYRSQNGDKGTWAQVNIDGFTPDTPSEGARTMMVYKNLLWVVTLCQKHGTQVWVTNGEKDNTTDLLVWKKANMNGFGQDDKIHGSRAMVVYEDKLYIGTQCKQGVPRIFRYDGPVEFNEIKPEMWTWINPKWQLDDRNILDFSLVGFLEVFRSPAGKEYMYAGVYSDFVPLLGLLINKFSVQNLLKIIKFFTIFRCRILRYDGMQWESVGKQSFGKPNKLVMSSVVFHDILYVGTTNFLGAEIWKTEDGTNFVRIMKRGFGYLGSISVWRLHTYKNRLLVGMQNHFLGCQIWTSIGEKPISNTDFIQIARRGMQKNIQLNPFHMKQDGIRVFETFNGWLYAAASSEMNIVINNVLGPGCEVWRINHL